MVVGICQAMMEEAIPGERASRDFRCKFPDDVLQENLSGLLWFGAECLAAGSNILNRERESANMRPLAKALTRSLDNVRCLLREQCLRNPHEYPVQVCHALRTFDRLFAEFELSYVSAMVPIKSAHEYHLQQEVVVLFSETLQRAMEMKLVDKEMVDGCDPALMFTIPRLAIVAGLLLFPEGPLDVTNRQPLHLSQLYRPFYNLLCKIRELLQSLSREELWRLEKTLCQLDADARGDLVHSLFVCIAGVADQLQTNFASEMRHILKQVFAINAPNGSQSKEERPDDRAPSWLPDELISNCMECSVQFTILRRRHHCRRCGKIFCSRCSSNTLCLPHYVKPVRVCNSCFVRHFIF
ncbi:lateral signaling target protein 2 homolog isoform X2 [Ornithodoros turicata]|uniref:lateral signaling target protein 2 homolog isoform X2 n=1 Tax=Ornithodoros turicata TaxID=34597 RepID=UPI00313A2EDE